MYCNIVENRVQTRIRLPGNNKSKLRKVPANMASHVCKRNTYHFNSVDLDMVSDNCANKLSIPLHLWVIWKGTVWSK